MTKKTRKGLFSSLRYRFILVSISFLVLPLIIYTFFLYFGDYKYYKKELMNNLDIILNDQIDEIEGKRSYNNIILKFIKEYIFDTNGKGHRSEDEIRNYLKKTPIRKDISAFIFAEINQKGKLISKVSTYSMYEGMDISRYINTSNIIKQKPQVIIIKDPVFGFSIYDIEYIRGKGGKLYLIIAVTSFENQLSIIQDKLPINGAHLSILNSGKKVISTNNKHLMGKVFSNARQSNTIHMKKIKGQESGRDFIFKNKQYYADIKSIGQSSYSLMISVKRDIVLGQFLPIIYRIALFLIIVLIVGGGITFFLIKRMGRPMDQLNAIISSMGSGDIKRIYKNDRFGFEINDLGQAVNKMQNDLSTYIEQVKLERGEKDSLKKELEIGHDIQKALLPSEEVNIDGIEIATYYTPAREVAGDFYDYLELNDQEVLITIADGVGKGISSCLYSFDLRSILRTAATSTNNLKDIALMSNRIFCNDTKESCNFVTLVTGILNKHTSSFEFTNAGHLPVFVKRNNNDIDQYTTSGMAFGIEEIDDIEKNTIKLEKGDFCILYTDGLLEGLNEENILYSQERLLKSIKESNASTCNDLMEKIIGDLNDFVGNKEQYDDISILIFRI